MNETVAYFVVGAVVLILREVFAFMLKMMRNGNGNGHSYGPGGQSVEFWQGELRQLDENLRRTVQDSLSPILQQVTGVLHSIQATETKSYESLVKLVVLTELLVSRDSKEGA